MISHRARHRARLVCAENSKACASGAMFEAARVGEHSERGGRREEWDAGACDRV